ncbi:MAG TPA: hypothetical protein VM934_15010 [Pyrinomonadaceae bacterium]|nr:hypothetical protein [Pyrinomonadaceae bacterium]
MNRLFLVCALAGLCAAGCSKVSDTNTATQNASGPVAAASASPTTAAVNGANQRPDATPRTTPNVAQGDVTGAYFAKGSLPREFSEIEHLSLATIDEQGKPAPLNGFIRPKRQSAKDYKLVNPKLDGKNLTFTTDAVDGVSYGFTGTFEKLGNFSENPPPSDEVVLKGTLTKMSGGKATAETKVNFTYEAGG